MLFRSIDFFFGKLFALWTALIFYLIFSFFMAYIFIFLIWIKQPYIEVSFIKIIGYLVLQILCFVGYSSFLWLLSCLIPYRNIVLVVVFFLLGTLYLYLTRISGALDLEYSFYKYWIVGLSDEMGIDVYMNQLPTILITDAVYIFFPVGAAYWIFQKANLRGRRR